MLGRIARTLGYLIAGVGGWIAVYLALTAVRLGFSYLGLTGFRGYPPLGTLRPVDLLNYGGGPVAVAGATFMVALWWALGAETGRGRALRITLVVAWFGAVGFVGFYLLLSTSVPLAGPS